MLLPMKKLIIIIIACALIAPATALSIEKLKRSGKIEMDETGGYSEGQRDYHHKRAKQNEEKGKGGYYEGGYHSKSTEFQPGEWQFVDSSGKGSTHKTKKYKKVKESKSSKEVKEKDKK